MMSGLYDCWWCGKVSWGGICLAPHPDYNSAHARQRFFVEAPGAHPLALPLDRQMSVERDRIVGRG
jgi:hypothetical protein